MAWKAVLGWTLVSCGIAGVLYEMWCAYAAYVIRSILPFTEWDPVGVIGSIMVLFAVSVAAIAFGIRLVRRSGHT